MGVVTKTFNKSIIELAKHIDNTDTIKSSIECRTEVLRRAIQEYKSRQANKYYSYAPSSPKHYDFHFCGKRIRINQGANRAGKTTCAVWDVVAMCLNEHPVYKTTGPQTWWIVGSTFKKVKDMLWLKFEQMSPKNRVKEFIFKPRANEYKIVFDNGSIIVFKSQEEGVSEFTSYSINGALIDERIYDDALRTQLRMRIVDTAGMLIFTMDKLEDDEWVEDLSKSDIAQTFKFEIRDNARYLPKGEIERLEKELDAVDRERLLNGNYAARDVNNRFKDALFTAENYVAMTPERMNVINGSLVSCEDGYFRIFELPQPGVQYIIGIDVAEGTGWNHTAMEAFRENGEQVFEFMTNEVGFQLLPELIGHVGKLYNNATVVVENKSYGVTVIDRLKDFYPNLFFQNVTRLGKFRNVQFGIKTERNTKEAMIVNAIDYLANNKCLLKSEKLVKQLKRFVTDADGKTKGLKRKDDPEMIGNDDDNAMAFLFAMWALNSSGIYKRYEYNKEKLLKQSVNIDKNSLTRYYRIGDSLTTSQPSVNFW